jgi:DNA-binding CsgD family transcriptional regulator
VDAHVNHIYAKLRISSRVQLTIWERERGPGSRPDQLSPTTRA